jgi:uncharacterized protein YfaS (alpha-2-macroglobulin family)/outer membrane protein assembly factor BamD (BamD/ComL family)
LAWHLKSDISDLKCGRKPAQEGVRMKPSFASRSFLHLLFAWSLYVAVAVGAPSAPPEPASGAPDPLEPARASLRARDFDGALKAIEPVLAAHSETNGEAGFLKALALFHKGDLAGAVAAGDELADATESPWYRKARFLKARALYDAKKFKEAEALYAEEANRLLSESRKQEIASVIVKFADELATTPPADALDAPPPDYSKAYNLYGKVLEMQIGRALRDEVLFKRARAIQKAGNAGQAVNEFNGYLREFDPDWTGTGSAGEPPRLKQENPPAPGKERWAARYGLAESHLKNGNAWQARRELEDLARLIEKEGVLAPGFKADVAWLLTRTFGFPRPAGADLDAALRVARSFLERFPRDRRAVRMAYEIAEAHRSNGRSEAAIQAYRDFAAGKGFALPEGALATERDPETGKSPAEQKDGWEKEAVAQVGALLHAQAKFDEAITEWQTYVTRFPNGPQWADCQNRIINAEHQKGLRALADKKEAEARRLFEAFLAAHPLDQRARQILFIFGQMRYVHARDLEEKKAPKAEIEADYKAAIEEWAPLISKYPNTEESSLALHRTAQVYEEKLGDLEKALEQYRRLTWGGFAGNARSRIETMTRKELSLSSTRTYRTGEPVKVLLKTRNIAKVTVKHYTLDLEAFFRKTHGTGNVEDLDIALIQPDRTAEFKIDGYAKYKPFEQEVEIPLGEGKPGVCVVNVSEEDWEATTLAIRSDLELIAKSSRREALVFVENRVAKQPAAGVKVLLSDGKAIVATGTTGPDGVYRYQGDELKTPADVRVFAIKDGHVAAQNLNLAALKLSSGLVPKGYIYTDRPVYRPGDKVAVRGILRDARDGAYAVPQETVFAVTVTDSKGRLVREESLKLSEFGTFHTAFGLPGAAPEGDYTVMARAARKNREPLSFSGTFTVKTFKPEKIRLTLELPRTVYFRGETIEAEVCAAYYWGEPATGKPVRCTLPDGRVLSGVTDDKGKAKFTFDTTPSVPGQPLPFRATLEGENIAAGSAAMLALQGFDLSVKPSQEVVLTGEPVDIAVKATAADGKPAGRDVTLTVLRQEQDAPNVILDLLPWASDRMAGEVGGPPGEVTVQEFKLKTDPITGAVSQNITVDKGGRYVLRVTGQDQFGQTVTGQGALQVSGNDDAVKLRLFAQSSQLRVGGRADLRLHARVADGLALVTHEGETILRYRIVPVKEGYNDVAFDVGHEHFPNFRVAVALMDGRELRSATKDFTVERELKVAVKPLKDAFLPGEEGKVELTVTDQLGRPVRAELSLALVDEGVFAVVADRTPAILDFFQREARRYAEFQTGATCGFRYAGISRRVIKEILAESERLNRDRKEREAVAGESRLMSQAVAASAPMPAMKPARARLALGRAEKAKDAREGLAKAGEEMDQLEELAPEEVPADEEAAKPASGVVMRGLYARRTAGGRKAALAGFGGAWGPGGGGEEQARRELPEEGRWFPDVVTDAGGKAVVPVKLPEKTTEWRLTARGCSVETLVGEAQSKTLTRKDFFVEIKAPGQVQEGDSVRVLARVHNLTSNDLGTVRLQLEMAGAGKDGAASAQREKQVEVKAGSGAEVVFEAVEIPAVPGMTLTVRAQAGDRTDALTVDVPVRPYGLDYAANGGGVAAGDAGLVLELPAGQKYRSQWMLVSVGPSLRQTVLDLALSDGPWVCEALRAAPGSWGCPWGGTDGSELLAKAAGLAYARRGKAPELDVLRLIESTRALASGLVASQRDDGGWSWGGLNSGSDWAASARAFWALVEARDLGIPVHTDAVARAQAFLQNSLQSFEATDNDAKAVVLHALSANKAADFANCNRLHRDRQGMGNAALAYLALAFLNLDRPDFAKELLDLIETRGEAGGDAAKRTLSWEPKARHEWMKDRMETTALTLLALARGRPASPVARAAAEYLLNARGCGRITPAKARGPVVAALAAWFGTAREAEADFRMGVQVNGTVVTNLAVRGEARMVALAVPQTLLKDGKNLIDFKMEGRGEYAYAATLLGFSADLKDPASWSNPCILARRYHHAPLEYRGRPIGVNSTSPVTKLESGQRMDVWINLSHNYWMNWYMVMEEPLPAGTTLVEGSLQGNFSRYEVTPGKLLLYYPPNINMDDVRYQVVGYAPGVFRALPTTMRDAMNPGRMRIGPASSVEVLGPGEPSPDPFQINNDELFALGRLYFEDGVHGKALENLSELFKRSRTWNERDTARMLLWIHTLPAHYDARKIVEMFEILRERYPELQIPFDKILVVARAYRDIGEFERACLVARATIAASFVNDSGVSATLQDEGRLLGAIDYQERLWREYPDTAEVVSAWFALAQTLLDKAPNAHQLPKEGGRAPEKMAMLRRAAGTLNQFLALYPNDPLADDAAFSLCNTWLDLKGYGRVVDLSRRFAGLYTNSVLNSSFRYMTALGLFWQSDYTGAVKVARAVAEGDSADRDFAGYIVGQICHAEGRPAEAIEWYRKVQDKYRDAKEAIGYFQEQRLTLEEVTVFRPGAPVDLPIKYRNIKEAALQVYRVDLMKLYLREKNLSGITSVRLAGIKPEVEMTVPLGDGKDYVEKEKAARLALKDEGAYLVICRGDDLFASGLVLVTPLKMEVQEDNQSGQVRANVLDAVKGGYRAGVHVKAIGSADREFKSGETDLRGIFAADGLRGKATVIARDAEARYAFYRGANWLGAPEKAETPPPAAQPAAQQMDYQMNLRSNQQVIQGKNIQQFEQMRRTKQSGVQINQAF